MPRMTPVSKTTSPCRNSSTDTACAWRNSVQSSTLSGHSPTPAQGGKPPDSSNPRSELANGRCLVRIGDFELGPIERLAHALVQFARAVWLDDEPRDLLSFRARQLLRRVAAGEQHTHPRIDLPQGGKRVSSGQSGHRKV